MPAINIHKLILLMDIYQCQPVINYRYVPKKKVLPNRKK